MRELTINEVKSINGAGNDSYDPTSLVIGVGSTLMKLPAPVGIGVTVATEYYFKQNNIYP